jgi:hypothetical protein
MGLKWRLVPRGTWLSSVSTHISRTVTSSHSCASNVEYQGVTVSYFFFQKKRELNKNQNQKKQRQQQQQQQQRHRRIGFDLERKRVGGVDGRRRVATSTAISLDRDNNKQVQQQVLFFI